MSFGFDASGEAVHSFDDFHEAFLALALLATRRRDFDAELLGDIEQHLAARSGAGLAIEM